MRELTRRGFLGGVAASAAIGAVSAEQKHATVKPAGRSGLRPNRHQASDGWVATWVSGTTTAPPSLHWQWDRVLDGFESKTLRQCLFTSVGGDAARVRISNRYGKEPLRIGKAALGVKRKGIAYDAELVSRTIVPITFSGSRSVAIPAGQEMTSDAIPATILPHQTLAVDLYFPDQITTPEFSNTLGLTYRAEGDRAGIPDGSAFTSAAERGKLNSYQYLIGVDVHNPRVDNVIVCGGDSLSMSTPTNGFMQWPQILSRRLRAAHGDNAPSVVQSLMSGNRLLTSGPSGPSVLERFERDLLRQPGVTKIILFAGFNDLAYPNFGDKEWTGPRPIRSADEMIAGYSQAIDKAHHHGVAIYGCTITPGMDSGSDPDSRRIFDSIWSETSERTRHELNEWFRSAGKKLFDGVFDFAAAIENPLDRQYSELSCSADGVHPNDGGYYAMAQVIDIKTLMG